MISHDSCQYQIRIKLKAKEDSESPNPTSWLSNEAWAQICSLQQLEAFKVKQEGKEVQQLDPNVQNPEGQKQSLQSQMGKKVGVTDCDSW